MVGKTIAGRRDDVVIATKAGLPMGDERNHQGGPRRWLFRALDNSLRRLGVDHVDLYQVHRWDPRATDEETLSALTDLQRTGKVRYFGSSTFPAYRIVEAQWAAREHHLSRYVTEQPGYSILQRAAEAHVLPVTEDYGLGVLVWSPLASGWLSGAVREGRAPTTSRSSDRAGPADRSIAWRPGPGASAAGSLAGRRSAQDAGGGAVVRAPPAPPDPPAPAPVGGPGVGGSPPRGAA